MFRPRKSGATAQRYIAILQRRNGISSIMAVETATSLSPA